MIEVNARLFLTGILSEQSPAYPFVKERHGAM
jgi:hypothetical protein